MTTKFKVGDKVEYMAARREKNCLIGTIINIEDNEVRVKWSKHNGTFGYYETELLKGGSPDEIFKELLT